MRDQKDARALGVRQATILLIGGFALGLFLTPRLLTQSFSFDGSFTVWAAAMTAIAIGVMSARLVRGLSTGIRWLLFGVAFGGGLWLAHIAIVIVRFDSD